MAIDPTVAAQLDQAHGRGIQAVASMYDQIGAQTIMGGQADNRRIGMVAEQVLYDDALMDSKAGYYTPVTPGAAPVPTPVATK